jgi:hypothetical protein
MEWINLANQNSSDEDTEAYCARSEATATTDHSELIGHRKPKGLPSGSRRQVVWSKEEDAKLHKLMHKHGTDWVLLASHFPDRTPESLQARWETIDPCNAWSAAEDRRLLQMYHVYGANWRQLSRDLSRPASEVKTRYFELQEQVDETSAAERAAATKERHLGELYQQIDIMKQYLEGLQSEMSKLQRELSETVNSP